MKLETVEHPEILESFVNANLGAGLPYGLARRTADIKYRQIVEQKPEVTDIKDQAVIVAGIRWMNPAS